MNSQTTNKSKTTPAAGAVSLVLRSVTLAEATDDLRELAAAYSVVPAEFDETLNRAIANIEVNFVGNSIYDLIEDHAVVLAKITGIPTSEQGQYLRAEQAEPLHLHRNVVLALVMAATLSIAGADVNAVTARFKTLKQRTAQPHRAYIDDEILLLRLYAVHLSRQDLKSHRAAAIYTQVDAGLTPGETQSTTPADVDASPGEGLIEAHGNAALAARVLPLDTYGATMLGAFIRRTSLKMDDLLTYRPRKQQRSFPQASASSHQAVDRIREAVGLTASDTKASSVTMWRVETIYRQHGEQAALEASGRSCVANLREVLWHGTRRQASPAAKSKRRTSMLGRAA